MEGKKRNKKNKNKQAKEATTNVAEALGAATTAASAQEPFREPVSGPNHQNQRKGDLGSQECGILGSKADPETHEFGKNQVDIDEKLKLLKVEIEIGIDEKLNSMKNGIDSCVKNVVDLCKKFKTMQNEVNSCVQKEDSLTEKVEYLMNVSDSFSEEKVHRDAKLEELKDEINSWILKEKNLKERIISLEDHKDSSAIEEKSNKEVILQLGNTNIMLQKQVIELEESRDNLVHENQQLSKTFTALEARILQLEKHPTLTSSMELVKHLSEDPSSLDTIETANEMAEEVIFENAEIIKKVDQSCGEPHHHNAAVDCTSVSKIIPETDPNENIITTSHLFEPYTDQTAIPQDSFGDDGTSGSYLSMEMPVSAQQSENGENLQISLTEIEIEESNVERTEDKEEAIPLTYAPDKEQAVPLTDAPLVGAPFRLVSFIAKYVSGADLVNAKGSTLQS